jgi:hypothetical protein
MDRARGKIRMLEETMDKTEKENKEVWLHVIILPMQLIRRGF